MCLFPGGTKAVQLREVLLPSAPPDYMIIVIQDWLLFLPWEKGNKCKLGLGEGVSRGDCITRGKKEKTVTREGCILTVASSPSLSPSAYLKTKLQVLRGRRICKQCLVFEIAKSIFTTEHLLGRVSGLVKPAGM